MNGTRKLLSNINLLLQYRLLYFDCRNLFCFLCMELWSDWFFLQLTKTNIDLLRYLYCYYVLINKIICYLNLYKNAGRLRKHMCNLASHFGCNFKIVRLNYGFEPEQRFVIRKPPKLLHSLRGKRSVASHQNRTQDFSRTFQVKHCGSNYLYVFNVKFKIHVVYVLLLMSKVI